MRYSVSTVVMIGTIAVLADFAALAAVHLLSRSNIPVLSPGSRAVVDFLNSFNRTSNG